MIEVCRRFLPLILCVLLIGGCGSDSTTDSTRNEKPQARIVSVALETVVKADLVETFTLPATLEAWEDLTLAAEISGPVRFVGPREGDRVSAGQVILRIDPEARQADLQRAFAEFEMQQNHLVRMTRLRDEQIVSPQEFEDARASFEVARAVLRNAEVALSKSELTSPVDGIIDRLMVDRGEFVSEGTPVAELVQVDRLQAVAEVPEKDVSFLRVGDKVDVVIARMTGEAGETITGEIFYLAFKADPVTRTYRTKVAVNNAQGTLRPGMILRIRFQRQEFLQVVTVPLYAVLERAGQNLVFIEDNGVARARQVLAGNLIGDRVIIREGLSAGERLVVQGQQLLEDGALVAVVSR